MAHANINAPPNVVERNILLTGEIMQYLLNTPQVFNSLPDQFELVVLPDDDPEIRLFNLELLDRCGSEGKPVVFARIKAHPADITTQVQPSIFVPIPLAV